MKLDTEFRKLPLRFDAERLALEVRQFSESDWRGHPQGHKGNSAIPLIAVEGDPANDGVKGPMRPTPLLERCPYVRQVLAALDTPLGRTRFMRIVGQGEATAHVDTNYYWMQRVRVHVPLVTFPEVEFVCGGRSLHMAAGECWIFDTWRLHNVLNPNAHDRIHLVADTVGSASFWELAARAQRPFAADPVPAASPTHVPYVPHARSELATEHVNFPVVMSPWEQECLIVRILEDVAESKSGGSELAGRLEALLEKRHRQWRALWAQHGDTPPGWPAFTQLVRQLDGDLADFAGQITLPNNLDVVEVLRQAIIRPALNTDLLAPSASEGKPASLALGTGSRAGSPRFERPIFIVSAPRSGSTLLFETLARSPTVHTIGSESHEVFEGIPRLNPQRRGYDSNRLTSADCDAETAETLCGKFLALLRDRAGHAVAPDAPSVRLLEKTPKNSLRVPFLNAVFPDALFLYLYREPHENISSILDAWRSKKFVTYPELPGWKGLAWSLLLIPGWRELSGRDLPSIAAEQWAVANRILLDDLEQLPRERWAAVSYAELVNAPQRTAERLCHFAGIAWDQHVEQGQLPASRHTLTPPDPNKWRKNIQELAPLLPRVEAIGARARRVAGCA